MNTASKFYILEGNRKLVSDFEDFDLAHFHINRYFKFLHSTHTPHSAYNGEIIFWSDHPISVYSTII